MYFSSKWKKHISQSAWSVVRLVIILGLCYVILYPFFIKIVNGFKDYMDFLDPTVRFIPKHFTTTNVRRVIERMDYVETFRNTALLSIGTALLTTFISSFIAYGFARYKFKGNGLLFFCVIFTLIVPPQTVIIPLFLRFRFFAGFLNLLDTPFPVLIMPKELEEAAYLDGCGAFNTYFRIMLPSAKTMLITVFLLSMAWGWTDTVYNPLFFPNVQLFVNMVPLVGSGEVPIMSANMTNLAALLSIAPLALIYFVAQNFFVQSIERAGIVG